MQCSSRKFVASQIYYGLRIANPGWPAERITDAVIAECDMLIKKLDRRPAPGGKRHKGAATKLR